MAVFNFKKVLVVEDIAPVRRALRRIVERLLPEADIEVAADGEQALQMLRRAAEQGALYDLCVSDIQLPKRSGLEVVEMMRRKDVPQPAPGNQPETIFVLTTGRPTSQVLAAAVKLGVPVLPKPFTLEELAEAVEKAQG